MKKLTSFNEIPTKKGKRERLDYFGTDSYPWNMATRSATLPSPLLKWAVAETGLLVCILKYLYGVRFLLFID